MSGIFSREKFLLFSHRGGAGLFPENTLYAFERSVLKYGADAVELDIHMSRDGELIVIHDDTLDRTTNGSGRVYEKTAAEIKRYDAGYRFTKDGGRTWPFRGKGLTVPLLSEVFMRLKPYKAGINIEIKEPYPGIEQKLYKLITGLDMTDRVLVNSGHPCVLKRFRKLNEAGILTGADALDCLGAFVLSGLKLDRLYTTAAHALQVPLRFKGKIRVVTKDLVRLCREKRLKLHVWTLNEAKAMEEMLSLGVDGIMTDYPDRLCRLVKR